jgi:pre-rRNA-processing protein TSR4
MASYDSGSSLDDQTDCTKTGVLLGYASKEATGDAISHLGSIPVRNPHPLLTFELC